MGDVHPYGNPHYWTDPENGRVIARAIAARLAELDPSGRRGLREEPRGLRGAAHGEGEGVGRRRWLPTRARRSSPSTTPGPTSPSTSSSSIVGHVEPKPGIPPTPSHTLEIINLIQAEKVPVILVEPYFDRKTPNYIARQDRRGRRDLLPVGRRRPGDQGLLLPVRLRLDAFVAAMKGKQVTHLRDPAAGLRGEPDPDRDPRLSRRPRRRAGRHLRRPLARADRRARARRSPISPATTSTRRPPTSSRSASPSSAPRSSPSPASHRQDAHPAGGDHRHRLRGLGGRRDPRHVQGDAGDRAPEGDARRQHPLGVLDGARRRPPSSTRSSASSTTSSASASCSSR